MSAEALYILVKLHVRQPGAFARAITPIETAPNSFVETVRTMSGPTQTLVIKVGTSSLVNIEKRGINIGALSRLCEAVRNLKEQGHKVVVVSSGAVGVGCQRLGLSTKPTELAKRQALAAAGQVHLMRYYDDFFSALGITCAQVMLTLDNLAVWSQYSNTRSTFEELFAYGVVPVVNENDTVAVEELRFGDNDTLSAKVATAVQADWLFLLTDVDALYTADPGSDPDAEPIREIHDIAQLHVEASTSSTEWGTGGMSTKLTAARIATAAGCRTVICHASEPANVEKILNGVAVGTVFHHHPKALKGRKRWIIVMPAKGQLWIDSGAVRAVRQRAKSLFPAGIVSVVGDFNAQDAVQLCDVEGVPFAQCLSNYASDDIRKLQGRHSQDIQEVLGFAGSEEIAHRDNISMLTLRNPPPDATSAAPPYSVQQETEGIPHTIAEPSEGVVSPSNQALVGGQQEETPSESPRAPEELEQYREGPLMQPLPAGSHLQANSVQDAGPGNWGGPEDAHTISPRSDSATSLTRRSILGDQDAPQLAASPQGYSALPPRSPVHPRGLQPSPSDDRPNPLPSPASGFRSRVPVLQHSLSSQEQLQEKATGQTLPNLEIPEPTATNGAINSNSPIPDEFHGVVSPDVASAAMLSSQGPIREATEADIAARRALIAAAKSGKMADISPRQSDFSLSEPSVHAHDQGATMKPSTLPAVKSEETDCAMSPPGNAQGEVRGQRPVDGIPAASPRSATELNPGRQDLPRQQSGTAPSPQSQDSSRTFSTPIPNIASSLRLSAASSAANAATDSGFWSPQQVFSGAPQPGRANSNSSQGGPFAGATPVATPQENFRPMSTAMRSMYTPMRNHEFSRRRSVDESSPGVSRQGSGRLYRQPSEPPILSPVATQSYLAKPASQTGRGDPQAAMAVEEQGIRELPGPSGGLRSSLRKLPSSDMTAVGGSNSGLTSNGAHGGSRETPPSLQQASSVEDRLAVLRQREEEARGLPAKRVTFQADSWLASLGQAMEYERKSENSQRDFDSPYDTDVTTDGWLPS